MDHKDYDSALLQQVRNSVKDVLTIAENETFEFVEKCVPPEAAKAIGNIYLTGCGDSWCASVATQPIFENAENSTKTGMVPGIPTKACRNIEFSRYQNTYAGWNPLLKDRNALCAISISGSPARPNEAAMRMNELGGATIAFTVNTQGKLANNCKYVIPMTLPEYDLAPNVTSYYSSVFSLTMFALYLNTVKGNLTQKQAEEKRQGLLNYVKAYDGVMEKLSKQAYDLAKKWEEDGVDNMDFVGDGADYATAFFGSAKMVEAFGGLTTNDDSEDWCHINFFIKDTDHIGTFIIANEDSPAFSRELETVRVAASFRKHVAVITDADESLFPESVTIFRVPKPEGAWMHPLMEHIPMDFVAGYIGVWRGRAPFRKNEEPYCEDNDARRFRQSRIEII